MNTARKRVWAWFLAAVLLLTTILPAMGQVIVHADPDAVTLKIHYHREDGNYTDWDVWAWADGIDLEGGPPFLFADEGGEKVATINVPAGVNKIGYIVRKSDWTKDIDANQFIEFPEVVSGTLHFYIESGVEGGTKNYDDAVLVPTLVKIHYYRPDGAYTDWDVWSWADGSGTLPTSAYAFAEENDEMVATINIPEGVSRIGFIVRKQDWSEKDPEPDRFVDLSDILCGTVHILCTSGTAVFETNYDANVVTGTKIKSAVYKGDKMVEVTFTGEVEEKDLSTLEINGREGKIDIANIAPANLAGASAYLLTLAKELEDLGEYTITFKGAAYPVVMPIIYSTPEFEAEYTYDGDDLGLTVGENDLTFKLWAPLAEKVTVNVYEGGTANANDQLKSLEMTAGEKGIFSLTTEKDILGKYYTYVVTRNGKDAEVCDPYARATGVNGQRAMILDLRDTDPQGWDEDKNPHAGESMNDAVIYEVHVRDLSSDGSAGIPNSGTFLGFTATGTTTPNGTPTGIDHIADLGATHVHILPMYDFGSVDEANSEGQYNWGYDPVNYNVPEGSYSSDPYHGEVRVNELKQMVQAMHKKGLSVVMDVVYNHVQDGDKFCINQILPGYFSRIKDDGTYVNDSGCGNTTASERSMVRKYIVDSVLYWATEYHLDGFRFDLVGLLDTETINELVNKVHAVRPDVIFYGEGWSMCSYTTKDNVYMATQTNSAMTPDFAYFNDNFRDGLKGSVFSDEGTGYVNSYGEGAENMLDSWKADEYWSTNPAQIVQYNSCHDNLTIWDKLALSAPDASEADRVRMNLLAAAMTITAQGIPFMMSGEEMLRSKEKEDGSFDHNSYASPDSVNSLKWSTLEDPTVAKVYEYYKGLIAFRKAHPSIRLTSSEEVQQNITSTLGDDEKGLQFYVKGIEGDSAKGIFAIFNPTRESTTVNLPEGTWTVCVDADTAGAEPFRSVKEASVTVEPLSAMILADGMPILAKSVTLNKKSAALNVGKTLQLTATVKPEEAVDGAISWSTSDKAVATVSSKGLVTAKKAGKAVITAETVGGLTAACTITVQAKATSVSLNKKTAAVYSGKTLQLKATVSPKDAVDGAVTWSTSDKTVATVSKSGLVTARNPGKAVITAKTAGGLTAKCTVTVKGVQIYRAAKGVTIRYTRSLATAKKLKAEGCKVTHAFLEPAVSKTKVYWVYAAKTKHLCYTTDRAYALAKKKAGLHAGLAFYAADSGIPVYELVKSGARTYTTSKTEASSLKKAGYTYKGIAFKALKA